MALRTDATVTDLTAVRMRGGKIIHYHGWADPGVTPKMLGSYYEAAIRTMGEAETKDFYRFFPVPGMFHCGTRPIYAYPSVARYKGSGRIDSTENFSCVAPK